MFISCRQIIPRVSRQLTSVFQTRQITVLAIESSADDTCAAVVTSDKQILSNVVIKQHELHEESGGIYPITAQHAHQKNMPFAVRQAIQEAKVDLHKDINGIAFTRGPGMRGCLSVGMNAAKTLAAALGKPLVGVHHMQGHALTPLLTSPDPPTFPFIALLVSGGHTLLLLVHSHTSFRILAKTQDESLGRTIDKVSRILALKWTSLGPGDALEKFCAQDLDAQNPSVPSMPRPVPGKMEFSYAGLHSLVERFIHKRGGIHNIDLLTRQALAREFQRAAFLHLEEKLLLGIDWCNSNNVSIQDVVVSGGVASNQLLRKRLIDGLQHSGLKKPINLNFPPPNLCTDNAVMIAWASMHRFLAQDHDDYGIDLQAKWCLEDLHLL